MQTDEIDDEIVCAALDALENAQGEIYNGKFESMRAALLAVAPVIRERERKACAEGRAEAFEEAAAEADRLAPDLPEGADAIRKLA